MFIIILASLFLLFLKTEMKIYLKIKVPALIRTSLISMTDGLRTHLVFGNRRPSTRVLAELKYAG